MSIYTVSSIASIINGHLISGFNKDYIIKELAFDSRKIQHQTHVLFFALVSSKNDGHKYIQELYDKDIRNFVVNNTFTDIKLFPQANFIFVDNSLQALQTLANTPQKITVPVIGIPEATVKLP